MWAPLWPSIPDRKPPVNTVTNGIHVPTWIASDMAGLFERHLQKDWRAQHDAPEFWDAIVSIPDEELWAVREALRSYLIAFIRERTRELWTA
jgi:starch phosphorylase